MADSAPEKALIPQGTTLTHCSHLQSELYNLCGAADFVLTLRVHHPDVSAAWGLDQVLKCCMAKRLLPMHSHPGHSMEETDKSKPISWCKLASYKHMLRSQDIPCHQYLQLHLLTVRILNCWILPTHSLSSANPMLLDLPATSRIRTRPLSLGVASRAAAVNERFHESPRWTLRNGTPLGAMTRLTVSGPAAKRARQNAWLHQTDHFQSIRLPPSCTSAAVERVGTKSVEVPNRSFCYMCSLPGLLNSLLLCLIALNFMLPRIWYSICITYYIIYIWLYIP